MPPRPTFSTTDLLVLRRFQELEATGAGYRYRGVLGWALPEHVVSGALGLLVREFADFADRGLDRADVQGPGRSRAVHIYRIRQAGAVLLDPLEAEQRPVTPLTADRDDRSIYLPPVERATLLVLREAIRKASGPYDPTEAGWRSAAEVVASLEGPPQGTRSQLPYVVLNSLVVRGLAEQRQVRRGRHGRTLNEWRCTPLGASLPLLEWMEPG